ncbi:MAG: ABC transporter substrate-binding protein [Candidatus Hydrogenedentota bacterium]|nr:MAG: ABC transporter substrate-binding protein [Candidatus Hydrogenedentota bacterium]
MSLPSFRFLRSSFLLVLSLVFLSSFLPGCGGSSSPSSPGKNKTIAFAVGGAPNEIAFWERLAKEFESRSGIGVRLIRQPTNTDQRRQGLVLALKAHQSDPDVFLMDVAWIGQFAAADWLLPLSGGLSPVKTKPKELFENVIRTAGTYRNRVVALPVYVDAGLLYYRTDLLEKAGFDSPPKTWPELVEMASKIQRRERARGRRRFSGYVWQGAQYEGLVCHFLEVASSAGGGIVVNGKGLLHVASPQNVRALTFLRDLIRKWRISPPSTYTEMREEEVRRAFQQGRALFERNWPYAWALHQDTESRVRGKVGLAPLPHFDTYPSAATLGGWHIGISRFSDRKAAAGAFVDFVLSPEIQKRLALNLGWNPGRRSTYTDSDVLAKAPHLAALSRVFENAVARPNLPYWPLVSAALQEHLNAALAGRESPEDALKQAEEAMNEIAARYESP